MEYRHTLPVDSVLIDEFKILGQLGSGGFANTYLAYDLTLGREVAIKEYFPAGLAVRANTERVQVKTQSDEKQFRWGLNRFVREAKTLAKFRHPSVVRVFRVFDANDTAYIVLEFVRGANMETWLRSLEHRPTQDELDKVLPPLLDALEVVHSAGILHRDIKPANIYIREVDRQPVLLDFGAARYAMGDMAGTTAAIVSKGYSPHEAYATDGRMQGPWTDIYGLAATIYRALTGAAPPESTGRVLEDDCIALSDSEELREAYRPEFLAAIDAGLTIMPSTRPQSIGDWRKDLFPGLSPVSVPDAASLPGGVAAEWRPMSDQPSDAEAPGSVDETINPVLKRLSSPSYAARISGGASKEPSREPSQPRPSVSGPGGTIMVGSEPRSGASGSRPRISRPSAPVAASGTGGFFARHGRMAAGVAFLIAGASALFVLSYDGSSERDQATIAANERAGAAREAARAAEEARRERLALLAAREAEDARQREAEERKRKEDEDRRQAELQRKAQEQEAADRRKREEEEARQAKAREDARKRAEAARKQREQEAAEADRLRREAEAAEARARDEAEARRKAEADRLRKEAEAAEARAREEAEARRRAEAERQRKEREAAEAREREAEEARKRAEADRLRREREAAEAERQRKERELAAAKAREAEEAQEKAEEERKLKEREAAIARRMNRDRSSAEAERIRLASEAAVARAKEEERRRLQSEKDREKREQRLAALDTKLRLPTSVERAVYVKQVQTALQSNKCYAGELNGSIEETQVAMVAAERSYGSEFRRLDLARATSNDYESWLDWMRGVRSFTCPLALPADPGAESKERGQRAKRIEKPRKQYKKKSSRRASNNRKSPPRKSPKKSYKKKSTSSAGSSRDSLLRSTR